MAEELHGKTKPLASMEFVTKEQEEEGMDYIDLMRMNLENLYDSMKGGADEGNSN